MKHHFYNEEFKINDLIRASHPSGGTLVIDENSKEGLVEDIIEAQMKTLETIYRTPVLNTLAELGTTLDNYGFRSVASEVDSLLEKVAITDEDLWAKFQKDYQESSKFKNPATILKELHIKTRGWSSDNHPYNKNMQTKQGDPLGKAFRVLLENLVELFEAFFKNPSEQIVNEFNDSVSEMIGLTNQSLRYDRFMRHNKDIKDLLEELGLSWNDMVDYWRRLKSNDSGMSMVPDGTSGSGSGSSGTRSKKSNKRLMLQVQKLINQLLGDGTVKENGYEGDSQTWKVVAETLKLKAGSDFSNYRQLIKLLEKMLASPASKSSPRGSTKDKGSSGIIPKTKGVTQGSDADFKYQGKQIRDFPIARSLRYVNDPGQLSATALKKYIKSNYKSVLDQVSYFLAWLKQYGVIASSNLKAISPKFPEIKTSILDGFMSGTSVPVRSYERLSRYLNVIGDLINMLVIIMEEDAKAKSSISKMNIFDFLRSEFPPNSRTFSALENNSAARASLLNWLVVNGLADRQENMTKSKGVTRGELSKIQSQMQSILRGYGIK